MRIAVVGVGYWGSKHVRVLQGLAGVDRTVVVDPVERRRRAIREAFHDVDTYPTLDDALDSVDAVIVATPPGTHADVVLQAMQGGKHVLVEKPFATDLAAAEHIVEVAEASGLVLMAGHTFLYNNAVRELHRLVQLGDLGQPLYVDSARLNLGLYQRQCNVIWDLAPHDVSIIDYVLGAVPTRVACWAGRMLDPDHEDVAYLGLEYPDLGVKAQVHVSWLDPQKVRRVTVVGTRKMAVYNDLADEERLRLFEKSVEPSRVHDGLQEPPMTYRSGSIVSPYITFTEPLAAMDRDFVECARSGRPPLADGRAALDVIRVLTAAQQSCRADGAPVEVGELATA